jgi:hypothetical protein
MGKELKRNIICDWGMAIFAHGRCDLRIQGIGAQSLSIIARYRLYFSRWLILRSTFFLDKNSVTVTHTSIQKLFMETMLESTLSNW